MITDKKAANAMGGKTARACDGCLRKRARWYCAADDAFLCQGCDTSVHSANQLASRHERLRLETASNRRNFSAHEDDAVVSPAWHQGFTKKARTPRQNHKYFKHHVNNNKVFDSIKNPINHVVPEIGSEDNTSSADENEEQMICRVPVFDPFDAELGHMVSEDGSLDGLHDFLPSDMDLAEFAADVESLLRVGLDEDGCVDDIKGIELLDNREIDFQEMKNVKVKDEDGSSDACCFDSAFDLTFNYESPLVGEVVEEEKVVPVAEMATVNGGSKAAEMKRNMLLRLNYEAVITAWATQGSPWTTGSRPEFNLDEFMGSNAKDGEHMWGGIGGICNQRGRGNCITDREREARVSRYREKRRTRLFSKKIRYEVRKLNAEKRPRMKGRFVKRTSFVPTPAFAYIR